MTILITGGAGFIGSHVTDALIARGEPVRILDDLCEQVHGPGNVAPDYLNPAAEVIRGDIRDRQVVAAALQDVRAVIHLAAAVGVGQSMYEMARYMSVNSLGTTILLEEIIKKPVEKLIVASSMSIYGEGLYRSRQDGRRPDGERRSEHLRAGEWEAQDEYGEALVPLPTPENKPPQLNSIYALSKYDQERMCLLTGRAYGLPTIALRFFNTYGPRQALSNPYTGVLAIFAARLINDKPPLIFEDGKQRRDFVSVYDVARACCLALECGLQNEVLNIGGGEAFTVLEVAEQLASLMGKPNIHPVITGRYRTGDIRHCFADINRARDLLGYHPAVALPEGLSDLCTWLSHQQAEDHVERAYSELSERGLAV
jgi:dTDP-L-rhamnose 4-epimerase